MKFKGIFVILSILLLSCAPEHTTVEKFDFTIRGEGSIECSVDNIAIGDIVTITPTADADNYLSYWEIYDEVQEGESASITIQPGHLFVTAVFSKIDSSVGGNFNYTNDLNPSDSKMYISLSNYCNKDILVTDLTIVDSLSTNIDTSILDNSLTLKSKESIEVTYTKGSTFNSDYKDYMIIMTYTLNGETRTTDLEYKE